LEPDGTLRDLALAECNPSYRDGNLGERLAVGAVLALRVDRKADVHERCRTFLAEKNAVQPVSEHSCGCIFKNPDPELSDGRSAGKLIDDCGGKGRARGDAHVSLLHGNFIVNRGGAGAADVLTLIEDVRDLVLEKTGLRLESEARVWRA
ncbi:MAG TPA: UDP-N-acetylenolpyruvoylglucosamine reductase, partial [Planctomycetota bacterium]|nr:UDP-N-acetylenolpyruvoylglucosamine reductase [Planctomycetota bacterium]